jgi:hypothetical protein
MVRKFRSPSAGIQTLIVDLEEADLRGAADLGVMFPFVGQNFSLLTSAACDLPRGTYCREVSLHSLS